MNMSISSDNKKHNTQEIKILQSSENKVHFKNVHVKKQRKKTHITQKSLTNIKYFNDSHRPQSKYFTKQFTSV